MGARFHMFTSALETAVKDTMKLSVNSPHLFKLQTWSCRQDMLIKRFAQELWGDVSSAASTVNETRSTTVGSIARVLRAVTDDMMSELGGCPSAMMNNEFPWHVSRLYVNAISLEIVV